MRIDFRDYFNLLFPSKHYLIHVQKWFNLNMDLNHLKIFIFNYIYLDIYYKYIIHYML